MCRSPRPSRSGDELAEDEYVLDTPSCARSSRTVQEADRAAPSARRRVCGARSPCSTELLARPRLATRASSSDDVPESGMGGGIGQWLLYRAADRSLCLFSLVVPPGAMTPIHDHLAWGLIGLYRGNQDEEFYRPGDGTIELVAPAPARRGRPLRAAPAGRRHPPRPHDLRRHVGLDPPARERHGLRAAPHLRRGDGRGAAVPLGLRQRRVPGIDDGGGVRLAFCAS